MSTNAQTDSLPSHVPQNFPVVGIGASAGGLDAFKRLLESIPHDSGMAYVLVQHLSPTYESLLPEILSKFTELPVHEIEDNINLAPNHVYIIPENKVLQSVDGVLKLKPYSLTNRKNLPIDIFLKSLAETHTSSAVGIVLSGTGFDGALGLKNIKEYGGVTYAQTPETAAFEGMPQNAIKSGTADFVLPPEDIPQHLIYVNHTYKASHAYTDEQIISKKDEDIFKQILRILRQTSDNDFSHYKQPTLRRRIARRMTMTKNENPASYLEFLRTNKLEKLALFNDVLIPVSYFFRDSKIFDTLCKEVFPLLVKNRKPNDSIRFWVAACSTGEEAYSLAICLHEHLVGLSPGIKVQIFATDISENVITKARTGIYSRQELQNVSDTRLKKYFTKTDGEFHVNKVIRDMCIFAVHNFLKDPPFAKMDLVSCRNVMIYLDPFFQKKALTTFHYALKDQGVLFLGKSESAGSSPELFEPIIKNHKIYVRKSMPIRFLPNTFEADDASVQNGSPIAPKKLVAEPDFHKITHEILFNRYTPASVIINEHHDIVHFHGDTGPFLLPSPGKPNFDVLKMAREGLGFELRNTLLKVRKTEETITSEEITLKGENYLVNFEIIPILVNRERHFLILFKKNEIPPQEKERFLQLKNSDQKRIKQLESELAQLKEDIKRVTEDQEAVNEELQSANEELMSNSEELQSLNEKLEGAAEELQSNNEELISVNDELMERQEQLIASRQQAEAIVETIREPLIIIDNEMRIKRANSSFYKYFRATELDTEGRLFFELGTGHWNNPELKELLAGILPLNSKLEDFEMTINLPHLGSRSILVNAKQIVHGRHSEQLILIAFEDITDNKISKLLRESEARFRNIADTTPVLIWMSGTDKLCNFFNKAWFDYTGRTAEQELGNGWFDGVHPDDLERCKDIYFTNFDLRKPFYMEYRLKRFDGHYHWISDKGVPRFSFDGEFLGYVGGCMDIEDQKNFAVSLEEKVTQRTKELKDSEGFLQSVLNTTQNLIYIYDLEEQKIIFINKKSLKSTSFTPEEIINSDRDLFTEQIHPEDLQNVKAHRESLVGFADGKVATIEFRLKNDSDTWTYQLSRDVIFKRDASGKAIQYIGVSGDITDLKKVNELLIAKNQELEHSNVELVSFSSIASHDLKEPLRKIQMFSKLIIDTDKANVSEKSKSYLERVIISANRMQQLIDDLISYSRNNSEEIKLKFTDLNNLINRVLEDLEETIEENEAIIEVAKLPEALVLPSQFRQLFHNLISNAIKYRKKDIAPTIKISLESVSSEEILALKGNPDLGYCKILVTDNGIGFSNEYNTKIFEPFKRLHGKDEYSGTGIGLAICKKIMINHQGFITADSREGVGTVFSIYLHGCK